MSTFLTLPVPFALAYFAGEFMRMNFGDTFTSLQFGFCFVAAVLFHFYWHGFGDSSS
jgi:hypothetical protein